MNPLEQSTIKSTTSTKKSKRKPKGVRFVLSQRSALDPLRYDVDAPQSILLKQNDPNERTQLTADAVQERQKSIANLFGIESSDTNNYMKYLTNTDDNRSKNQSDFFTKDQLFNNYIGEGLDASQVDPEVAFLLEDDVEGIKTVSVNDKPKKEKKLTMDELTVGDESGPININKFDQNGAENQIDLFRELENDDNDGSDMEDDFVAKMLDGGSDGEYEDDEEEHGSNLSYAMQQYLGSENLSKTKCFGLNAIPEGENLSEFDEFEIDEKKTRFTEYSMSSSVMRRNKGLQQIDDEFESFYENFDDPDIGDLEHEAEDITNTDKELDPNTIFRIMQIHNKQIEENMFYDMEAFDQDKNVKDDKILKERTLKLLENIDENNNNKTVDEEIEEYFNQNIKEKPEYDAESILSTRSNLYNRPKYLNEKSTYLKRNKIKLNKQGLPVDDNLTSFKKLKKGNNRLDNVSDENSIAETNKTTLTVLMAQASIRSKNESLEEKRQRKALVKEIKKARREERKNTRLAFREEGIKQAKAEINKRRDKALRL